MFATFNKIPTAAEVSAEFGLESQGSNSSESGQDKKAGRFKVTPLSSLFPPYVPSLAEKGTEKEKEKEKEKDEGQEKDRYQAYLEKLYPLLAGAVDISTDEDECCSLLGVSYNTLSSIMTNHDVIKDILVRIVHNGLACGAGDASAPSDYVRRAVRQVLVSFYVRDCPSPGHARECVSFFSPLSLPLSSPLSLSLSLTIPTKNTSRSDLRRYHASCSELLRDERMFFV